MGDPLPQTQSSLVPSLVTIIDHPELQYLVATGEPTPTYVKKVLLENALVLGLWNREGLVSSCCL